MWRDVILNRKCKILPFSKCVVYRYTRTKDGLSSIGISSDDTIDRLYKRYEICIPAAGNVL